MSEGIPLIRLGSVPDWNEIIKGRIRNAVLAERRRLIGQEVTKERLRCAELQQKAYGKGLSDGREICISVITNHFSRTFESPDPAENLRRLIADIRSGE